VAWPNMIGKPRGTAGHMCATIWRHREWLSALPRKSSNCDQTMRHLDRSEQGLSHLQVIASWITPYVALVLPLFSSWESACIWRVRSPSTQRTFSDFPVPKSCYPIFRFKLVSLHWFLNRHSKDSRRACKWCLRASSFMDLYFAEKFLRRSGLFAWPCSNHNQRQIVGK